MASWKAQYTNVVISQDHLEGERQGCCSKEKAEQTSSAAAHNWASLGLKHRNRQVGDWMAFSGPYVWFFIIHTAFRGDVDSQSSMFRLSHWGIKVNLSLFWNPEFAGTDGIRADNTRKLTWKSSKQILADMWNIMQILIHLSTKPGGTSPGPSWPQLHGTWSARLTNTEEKTIITANIFSHDGCFIHGTSLPLTVSLKLPQPQQELLN